MSNAVVCLSGGIDSSTTLLKALEDNDEVIVVHFDYGQPFEDIEQRQVKDKYRRYSNQHGNLKDLHIVDLKPIVQEHYPEGCAVTRDYDPEEHRWEEEHRSSTTVPIRNLLFMTVAGAIGDHMWSNQQINIYVGSQKGEGYRCADCRPEMVENAQKALDWSTRRNDIDVIEPLLGMEKWEVLLEAMRLGIDFSETPSCSDPRDEQGTLCGKCPSCMERLRAFYNAGLEDPLAPAQMTEQFRQRMKARGEVPAHKKNT